MIENCQSFFPQIRNQLVTYLRQNWPKCEEAACIGKATSCPQSHTNTSSMLSTTAEEKSRMKEWAVGAAQPILVLTQSLFCSSIHQIQRTSWFCSY
jgi:hypothetical protein